MYLRMISGGALVALAACGGSGQPVGIVDDGKGGKGGSGGGGGTTFSWSWSMRTVDDSDGTGVQPDLEVAPDGRLAVAFFRSTGETGICELPGRGPAPTDRWEVVFAEERDGAFAQELIATVELVGQPTGVSLAFESDGTPLVAFQGGAPGEFRCGATDAVLASRRGGSWSEQILDVDGNVPAMAFAEDGDHCANYQDACNKGDVVGLWPAVGVDAGGPVVAYRDIHFGFGVDAEEKSDLQLFVDGSRITVDPVSGGGNFTRLVVDDAGDLHIAHHNPYHVIDERTGDYGDGVHVLHREGGAWSRERVVPVADIGAAIGLAADQGVLGLAWHESGAGRLRYAERLGGTWSTPATVDDRGRTGLAPSLAFDATGRPAIAFQRCGAAGQQGADCAARDDSLRFARRGSTGWEVVTVRNDEGRQEGLYTSLGFDAAGRPAIAFQESFFDPIDQVVRRKLVVATGVEK